MALTTGTAFTTGTALTQAQRDKAAWLSVYAGVAEGLLAVADASGTAPPSLNDTPLEVCWETLWQFRADDDPELLQLLQRVFGINQSNCFYGLLLRCTAAQADLGYVPGDLLAIIRGTCTTEEWIDNFNVFFAQDQTTIHPQAGLVSDGFYTIYKSMVAWDTAGRLVGPAAPALAALLKPGGPRLTIVGHSLGSALTSYLAFDIADVLRNGGQANIPARLRLLDCCLIACPNPGNDTYAAGFQSAVPSYTVIDWYLDIVPKLPPAPYARLRDGGTGTPAQTVTVLTAQDVSWVPLNSPVCNHHAVSYSLMLNPLNVVAVAQMAALNCAPIPRPPAAPAPQPAVPAAG
jgi:pimeloyl-ACP methyl ester carboxylesterase